VTTYLQLARRELDVVSDVVPRITGHPAVSLGDFLAAHPESYEDLLPT
jgi:NAD(P)H dehydrogenase (quinone)